MIFFRNSMHQHKIKGLASKEQEILIRMKLTLRVIVGCCGSQDCGTTHEDQRKI